MEIFTVIQDDASIIYLLYYHISKSIGLYHMLIQNLSARAEYPYYLKRYSSNQY